MVTGVTDDWRWKMAKKKEIDQKLYGKRARMFQEVLADADVVTELIYRGNIRID